MALANFFNKIALGASQILKGYNTNAFENKLLSNCVLIFFDDNAATTSEGKATLDLLVRLIARLYPVIQIQNDQSGSLVAELKKLALEINPQIEILDSCKPTVCVTVGQTAYSGSATTFYIGSNNWVTSFSNNNPIGSSQTNNPFGAGAASCFGAANVFRFVFQEQLPYGTNDNDFSFSLLNFDPVIQNNDLIFERLYFDEITLVGLGAIGNGVIWSLQRLTNITGNLIVVDHESVSLSNLQRYILATQDAIGISKVKLVQCYLNETSLTVIPQPIKWDEYISKRNNWQIETILTCLDSAEDRITIQGSLPKKIFNAWTQRENVGISWHFNFIKSPCLCCLYYPTQTKKSRSQEIADNLNMPNQEKFIREYLANNKPVDEQIIHLISSTNQISSDELKSFLGASLNIFYSEVVCGGMLMKLKDSASMGEGQNIDVPLAFESAFAGLLLAAEMIKNKLGYCVQEQHSSTQFNLLRPFSTYMNVPEVKKPYCICNDSIYQKVYAQKWPETQI